MSFYKIYKFKPKDGIWFTKDLVDELLTMSRAGVSEAIVSFNLGISESYVEMNNGKAWIVDKNIMLNLEHVKRIVKKSDTVYYLDTEKGHIKPVVITSPEGNYYKLRSLGKDKAPTLEINGIHMHNILDTDPWKDSARKVSMAKIRRGKVLDIGTGLGYTAINSYIRGAEVTTIEKDPYVLKMAALNPWSSNLSARDITIILGDAVNVTEKLKDEYFDAAIHDPPRFSLAGELYSKEFYQVIFRKLKKGANLFHYTGAPGKHRGVSFQKGVINRLRNAGFDVIRVYKDYGILARKPRL